MVLIVWMEKMSKWVCCVKICSKGEMRTFDEQISEHPTSVTHDVNQSRPDNMIQLFDLRKETLL